MKELEKAFEESQLGLNLLHYEILRLSKEPELTQVLLKKLYHAYIERQELLLEYSKSNGTIEDFEVMMNKIKEKIKNENHGTQRQS